MDVWQLQAFDGTAQLGLVQFSLLGTGQPDSYDDYFPLWAERRLGWPGGSPLQVLFVTLVWLDSVASTAPEP